MTAHAAIEGIAPLMSLVGGAHDHALVEPVTGLSETNCVHSGAAGGAHIKYRVRPVTWVGRKFRLHIRATTKGAGCTDLGNHIARAWSDSDIRSAVSLQSEPSLREITTHGEHVRSRVQSRAQTQVME